LEQGLGVHNVEFDAREQLSSLVQRTTVRKFAAEFRRLHDLIASEPVSGGEKVHKFLSGLKPELRKLCLVDPSRQNQIWAGCDFEKLVTFALTMEHSTSSLPSSSSPAIALANTAKSSMQQGGTSLPWDPRQPSPEGLGGLRRIKLRILLERHLSQH
jgi:hypothetical protein